MKLVVRLIAAALLLVVYVTAASITPEFAGSYSVFDLGSIAGLPRLYGGLTFAAGDPTTVFIGGRANTAEGLFYSVPVIRNGGSHITGFGAPTALGFGAYNDGGIAYAPGGVLLYSRWPVNQIGEVQSGSNTDAKVIALGSLSIADSNAALGFVPAGYNGAGSFKMLSWPNGEFYDALLSPDVAGTYSVASATQVATLSGGPEGFVYIPRGSPLFPSQSMLVSDFSANRVSAYDINAQGDPLPDTRRDFVVGLTGAEGAVIDPVTGDFLFSTFGGGDRILRVEGFAPSPPSAVPEPSTILTFVTAVVTLLISRRLIL